MAKLPDKYVYLTKKERKEEYEAHISLLTNLDCSILFGLFTPLTSHSWTS